MAVLFGGSIVPLMKIGVGRTHVPSPMAGMLWPVLSLKLRPNAMAMVSEAGSFCEGYDRNAQVLE